MTVSSEKMDFHTALYFVFVSRCMPSINIDDVYSAACTKQQCNMNGIYWEGSIRSSLPYPLICSRVSYLLRHEQFDNGRVASPGGCV